jgi:hypothetical protein
VPKLPQLSDNPVSTAVAAITAVLAGLNTFVSQFLLPPFWRDVAVSALLIAVFVDQCVKTRNTQRELLHAGGAGTAAPALASLLPAYVVVLLLAVVTVWTVFPVITHLFQPHWKVCGTFLTQSPAEGSCLVAYDLRNRQVSDTCTPIDDSHYVGGMTGDNWWTYKPVTFSIRENGKEGPHHPISKDMFSGACGVERVDE